MEKFPFYLHDNIKDEKNVVYVTQMDDRLFLTLNCENNNFDFVLSVLHTKVPKLPNLSIKLQKFHVGVCFKNFHVDLSTLDWVHNLTLHENIYCRNLPPFLQKISCDISKNLSRPFQHIKTLQAVTQTTFVKFPSEIDLFIEKNPQVNDYTFSIGMSNYETMFVVGLKDRNIILEKLSLPYHTITSSFLFQVLLETVKHLHVMEIDRLVFSLPYVKTPNITSSVLTSLSLKNYRGYSGDLKPGWAQNLETITIRNVIWTFPNTDFTFIHTCPKLERVVIHNGSLIYHDILRVCATQNCKCTCEFIVKHVCESRKDALLLMYYSKKDFPTLVLEYTEVDQQLSIQRLISWLPHTHLDFPVRGQLILRNLVLGLTRLKKFNSDPLVHVDPACIEFILEGFQASHCRL